MWRGRRLLPVLALGGSLLSAVAIPAQAEDERDAKPAVDNVQVLGQTLVTISQQADRGSAVASVHGVRRITGGTVLYWSVGYPQDMPRNPTGGGAGLWPNYFAYDRYGIEAQPRGVSVIDAKGRKVYEPLIVKKDGACLCSWNRNISATKGDVSVMYAVVPELPADVTSVDVRLGFGSVISGVPVESGALEPAKPADDRTVLLGQEWPTIDEAAVAASFEPAKAVYPLVTRQGSSDGVIRQDSKPTEVTLSLAADVLFAVDSASLSAKAKSVIAKAAAEINAKAQGGTLSIVGHTDSDGSNSYNARLSRSRADAVARALRPQLTAKVNLRTDGKGEADPVASNRTDEGKKLNRRVSITFETK